MACLRESSFEGRIGVVQCDEEGCEFRREQVGGPVYAPGDTSTGDCILQLRLRAGDTEKPRDGFPSWSSDEKLRYFEWVDKDSSYLDANNVRLYSIDLVKKPIHPDWRIEKIPEDFMYGPLWSRTHRPSPVDTGKIYGPERSV